MSITSPISASPYYEFDYAVWRFHQYQSIWTPVIGKELLCKHEVYNLHAWQLIHCNVIKDHLILVLAGFLVFTDAGLVLNSQTTIFFYIWIV